MTAYEKIQQAIANGTTRDLVLTIVLMSPHAMNEVMTLVAGDDFTHVDDAEGGDYVVLDTDTVDANGWVDYSEDKDFGGDGSQPIRELEAGQLAAEWVNKDFFNTYEPEFLQARLAFYEKFQ
ncbi:MAG: hypothetical protein NVS3B25_18960 [Hymenobacter sp.]